MVLWYTILCRLNLQEIPCFYCIIDQLRTVAVAEHLEVVLTCNTLETICYYHSEVSQVFVLAIASDTPTETQALIVPVT